MTNGFLAPEKPLKLRHSESPAEAQEVSSVEADKQALEQLAENKDVFLEQVSGRESSAAVSSSSGSVTPQAVAPPDEVTLEVEKILEADLGEYVQALPEEVRLRFQKKGQEVASEVAKMVRDLHVQAKRVLTLIRDWLLSLPGLNKFFLEQEAKIKTDQMMELERVRREDLQNRP